jgi:uncharacterized membrane protein
MPILVLSGFAMIFVWMGGMASVGWNVHAMLGLGLLMAAIFLYVVFVPYARFRRTTDRTRMVSSLDSIRRLFAANLVLGLITVVIAALQ